MTRIVCPQCGTVLTVGTNDNAEEPEWLDCVLPTGFEWTLPAGKISPVVGQVFYTDAGGTVWSRGAYMKNFGIDPEIAFERMRAHVRK